jgi:hypothetical protein
MQSIKVHRYANPQAHGWAGYLEPEDASWIAFIGTNGLPFVCLHRDPTTGAVLPDDGPEERAEQIERNAREGGLRIGMREDGTGWDGDTPLAVGERIFPLGFDGRGEVSTWAGHGTTWSVARKSIVTNMDCHSEEWWDAALARAEEFPEVTRLYVTGLRPARATVPAWAADRFLEVAATLPGWRAPYPVTVEDA